MVKAKQARYIFAAAILAVLLVTRSHGQTTTGTILGVVADEGGGRVPGAAVTVTNLDTGIARTLVTNEAGRYRASNLALGNYEAKAEMAGFRTAVRRGIHLAVGAEAVVELTLSVGAVTEQVEVTGEAPLVETTNASVSGLVADQQIRDLPLNGRSFEGLIFLQSGVAPYHRGDRGTETGAGVKFSVSGSRIDANSFLLDGTNMNDQSNMTPGSAAGVLLGVEALREFRVLTSTYSAEYGRNSGGIINAVTKSGTNELHGSLFEFLRNSALDARNFFDRLGKPSFKRNQFGATVGGPIRKDRAFYFLSYEGLRDVLGTSQLGFVPIAEARQGFLRNPTTGELEFVGVDPAVKPYLELYPLPNGGPLLSPSGVPTNTARLFTNPGQPTGEDYLTVRIDQQLSNAHSIFGRYTFDDSDTTFPDPIAVATRPTRARNQYATIAETAILSPTAVNVARLGFNRSFSRAVSELLIQVPQSLWFFPDQQFGRINFNSGGFTPFGNNTTVPQQWARNVWTVTDDLTLTRGRHTLKLGFLFDRYQENGVKWRNYGGDYTFVDLASFLSNIPFFVSLHPPGNDPIRGWRQSLLGAYVQDDMQVRPNLTLNLGFRYELATVPTEVNGKLANYPDPSRNIAAEPHIGDPWFKGGRKDFGPRIGFAWDPFSNGKTSLRGGFGLYFDHVISEPYNRTLAFVWPFQQFVQTRNLPVGTVTFPRVSPSLVVSPDPLRVVNFSLAGELLDPTKVAWSFSLQQEISRNTVLTASYVGSHSYHLTIGENGNQALSQTDPATGRKFIPQPAQFRNPNLGQVQFFMENTANASYNGLQLGLNRRLTGGFQAQVSYTWSRYISEADGTLGRFFEPEVRTGPTAPQNLDDRKAERALSLFDARHALALNFAYEFPFARSLPGLAGALLSGWSVNSILSFATGSPFSLQLGTDRTSARVTGGHLADRPDLKPGGNNNPVLGGPDRYYDASQFVLQPVGFFGNLGRNTVIGPGRATVDFSLVKNTSLRRISEVSNLQFRAEFFNLLNRANFGTPFNIPLTPTGGVDARAGVINRTITTARQIQFGLKFIF